MENTVRRRNQVTVQLGRERSRKGEGILQDEEEHTNKPKEILFTNTSEKTVQIESKDRY